MIDFYIFLIYKLLKVNSSKKHKEISKFALLWLFTFTFLFSFSGSNFGTNIRHRAKLLPVLAIFVFKSEKKYYERENFIS